MVPFYALIGSFLLFAGLGFLGIDYFQSWRTSLQAAVAIMLLLGASAHWGSKKEDLIRMVPPAFPKPATIVTVTGVLELLGAIGILVPATSKAASIGLALLLSAMFPANVFAARNRLTIGGKAVPGLFARTAIQLVFIAAVLLAGWG
ncbi:DoxX family protein [Saccharibacillus sp. CPCC 101409]|uniref:DoxX family protein n=1 Tax=Saccharibacillus sp. CPCC 101409 TaxID=3058041 RepID=UPI002672F93F|nr:DoxX family protein [Saccharibacillus sp. CPCC 101409]MDO3408912.1 DoxX family protein [Saccharibacillus sp. CPCC 101409]